MVLGYICAALVSLCRNSLCKCDEYEYICVDLPVVDGRRIRKTVVTLRTFA